MNMVNDELKMKLVVEFLNRVERNKLTHMESMKEEEWKNKEYDLGHIELQIVWAIPAEISDKQADMQNLVAGVRIGIER